METIEIPISDFQALLNITERRRVIIEQANDVFLQLKKLGLMGGNMDKSKIMSIVFDVKKQKQIAQIISFADADWIEDFSECQEKSLVEKLHNPTIDQDLGF